MRSCHQCGTICPEEHRFCPACGFPIAALRPVAGDPLIGRTLGNGYTILEHIASGGMGRVYRAEQAVLGKTLAVKVIHPHLAGDESAAARFYAEARACSRLHHPNSVNVIDFGRTDDHLLYLVMEYLRGRDLARLIWDLGVVPVPRAIGIMKQVLDALSEAHDLGIVHRDIKPENIIVEPTRKGDFIKVVDFGLAKIRTDVSPSVTVPGSVCGTPDYMAPEQARGLAPDPRSDLYSTAAVLYHCVTGKLPYESDSPNLVLLMHVNDPIPDPRTYVPDLPESFVKVLLRGLSKDPAARFQSAEEMAEAIEESVLVPIASLVSGVTDPTPVARGVTCAQCQTLVPPELKFCGECGVKVPVIARDSATRASIFPTKSLPTIPVSFDELPFVGRDAELSQLELARSRAAEGTLVAVRVVGEEGSGKHRLVTTLMQNARAAGDLVVCVGPDAPWAGVAYDTIARCIRALLAIPSATDPMAWYDDHVARNNLEVEPCVRAGILEVFTQQGARDLDIRGRTEAAGRALIFALREGLRSGKSRAVLLAFEQLNRMDTASVRVIGAILSRSVAVPACVVLTHTQRFGGLWARCETITLRGFSPELCRQALSAVQPAGEEISTGLPPGEVVPLHLDQIARWAIENGGAPPNRLVDLISARLERLDSQARRVLAALSIVGEGSHAMLSKVSAVELDDAVLQTLKVRGWIRAEGTAPRLRFTIAHPLVREVIESSLSAATRVELHRACVDVLSGKALPAEVRAQHALYTDEPFQTLVLLDQLGEQAAARGDDATAALLLRRGLEFARRELALGVMDEPDRAIVIFTRKLGEALVRAGDAAEAEGVLREGLGVAQRTDPEWARLEGALGKALCVRGRMPEGLRALESGIAAAQRLGARGVLAEIISARAEVDAVAKKYGSADDWLDQADQVLRESTRGSSSGDPLKRQRLEVLLRRARMRRLASRDTEAVTVEARGLAEELGAVMAKAQCDAESAERAEVMNDRRAANTAWRKAMQGARAAGDASHEAIYEERLRRYGRHE